MLNFQANDHPYGIICAMQAYFCNESLKEKFILYTAEMLLKGGRSYTVWSSSKQDKFEYPNP